MVDKKKPKTKTKKNTQEGEENHSLMKKMQCKYQSCTKGFVYITLSNHYSRDVR